MCKLKTINFGMRAGGTELIRFLETESHHSFPTLSLHFAAALLNIHWCKLNF